jgi:alkyl sulfatase BDS1-like metallo-beta-lactamase superfamily hydrolase
MNSNKPATGITAAMNAQWYDILNFEDEREKECALRGLIEAPESVMIRDSEGKAVWDKDQYSYMKDLEKAPDSVNPSLWRHTL